MKDREVPSSREGARTPPLGLEEHGGRIVLKTWKESFPWRGCPVPAWDQVLQSRKAAAPTHLQGASQRENGQLTPLRTVTPPSSLVWLSMVKPSLKPEGREPTDEGEPRG